MQASQSDSVLFVGDVHLGRRPVGLDEACGDRGVDPGLLTPAAGLGLLVSHALELRPRAVVFAGDLVDHEDDRFEAAGILEQEVARLRAEGIPVVAVAGNHDQKVLPRLLARVEGVHLLGARGTWECWPVPGPGRELDLLGWSFPERHVRRSPLDHPSLDEAQAKRRSAALALGVLHGDLDATTSDYAPVDRRGLEELDLHGCFLGHVHKPHDLSGPRPVGYLGSLVGLHINETGTHGAWRVDLGPAGVEATQLDLAPILWRQEQLDLGPLVAALEADGPWHPDDLRERLERELGQRLAADPAVDGPHRRLVAVRLTLVGSLEDRPAVQAALATFVARDLQAQAGDLPVVVESLVDHSRAALRIEDYLEEPSAVGFLANTVLQLEAGEADELVAAAAAELEAAGVTAWGLDPEDFPLEAPELVLARVARRQLEALVAQRAGEARR